MTDFRDPTAFAKDITTEGQARRFRAEWPNKVWAHQVAGGENVVVLVFAANQSVTAEQAKALATLVENQRPEIIQSGAMLATTLPDASEVPGGKDLFFKATFELLAATQRPAE